MSKTTKEKATKPIKNYQNAIIGVLQLLVVASIAYSSAVIIMGVDGYIAKALIAPQVIYAAVTLIKRFTK